MKELVAIAKAQPGKLNFGSGIETLLNTPLQKVLKLDHGTLMQDDAGEIEFRARR